MFHALLSNAAASSCSTGMTQYNLAYKNSKKAYQMDYALTNMKEHELLQHGSEVKLTRRQCVHESVHLAPARQLQRLQPVYRYPAPLTMMGTLQPHSQHSSCRCHTTKLASKHWSRRRKTMNLYRRRNANVVKMELSHNKRAYFVSFYESMLAYTVRSGISSVCTYWLLQLGDQAKSRNVELMHRQI